MRITKEIRTINKYRLLRHLLFWSTYVGIQTVVWGFPTGNFANQFVSACIHLPVEMTSVYVTLYFLFPKFLLKRKFIFFILFYILLSTSLSFIQRSVDMTILGRLFFPDVYENWKFFNIYNLAQTLLWLYMLNAITLAIKLSKYYFQKTLEHNKLIQEKLQAELKLLKSQIHPHFLFNTLNNLYALALEKSDKTAEGIVKLSDLLDYMLYDSNVSFISLEKELKMIEDYIELEKLRYGDRLKVHMNIIGNPKGKKIAPMLILPFVENSFKHGSSTTLSNTQINIDLKIALNAIDLVVENSHSQNKASDDQGYSEGIGLNNVQRRLDLIYSNKYQLRITDKDSMFQIHLHLKL